MSRYSVILLVFLGLALSGKADDIVPTNMPPWPQPESNVPEPIDGSGELTVYCWADLEYWKKPPFSNKVENVLGGFAKHNGQRKVTYDETNDVSWTWAHLSTNWRHTVTHEPMGIWSMTMEKACGHFGKKISKIDLEEGGTILGNKFKVIAGLWTIDQFIIRPDVSAEQWPQE